MGVKVKRQSRLMTTMIATANRMDERVAEIAKGAAKQASALAPVSNVEHVHLFEVITAKEERRGRWRIIADKGYAIYVELGTIFMDAIPYFRPAIASARRALRRDLKLIKGPPRIS